MNGKVFLERALSKLGIASREQTRSWVLQGRLTVNGVPAKNPKILVIPEKNIFAVDGKILKAKEEVVVLLHKTKGTVTTKKDEKDRSTIYDLLPAHLHNLHPVGRLDMYTTGLLLLTNNTRLSSYLTDPKNQMERVYVVTVRGEVTLQSINLLLQGIEDDGQILQAQKIEVCKTSKKESRLIVTLIEGKNREIRRMFFALGHEVTSLKRISFGPFHLGSLPSGKWRKLSVLEREKIPVCKK
jgi:23S rRNA pseudouridine2605 synthase